MEINYFAALNNFDCEVFNMFAHLIPQEGLSRIERGCKRHGLVPDFMLEFKDGIL